MAKRHENDVVPFSEVRCKQRLGASFSEVTVKEFRGLQLYLTRLPKDFRVHRAVRVSSI